MPDEIDNKLDAIEDGIARQPVLVGLVIDKSGSMLGLRDATISGLNEFLSDQRKQQGDVQLLITLFDTTVNVGSPQKLADVPDFDTNSYSPDGMTALLDGIGLTVAEIDKIHNGEKVVLCIVTDGAENQSQEYTGDQIKALLTAKQDDGWAVVYLGANQDAFANASAMGVHSAHTANYTSSYAGTHAVYDTMSNVVTRSATGQSTHITEDELIALATDDDQ